MVNQFIEKYNQVLNLEDVVIEGNVVLTVQDEYRQTDISINTCVRESLKKIHKVLKKKIEQEKVHLMTFEEEGTDKIFILPINDEIINPYDELPIEMEDYSDILSSRGKKILLPITINDNRYDIFIAEAHSDILKEGNIIKKIIDGEPEMLSRDHTLIISPTNFICIKDYELNILIIKKVKESSNIYSLNSYFKAKARAILSPVVINSDNIRINKEQITKILRNKKSYSEQFIVSNFERFMDVMRENRVLAVLDNDNEQGINRINPRINLESQDLNAYISGLNSITIVDNISGEETIAQR